MFIYYSGIEWLLKIIIGTRNITIIMFHSVNYNRFLPSKNNFTISPEEFRKKLCFLSRYNIISMDDVLNYFECGVNIPKNCIVLTFDDGYYDNYKFAFPILKELHLPATIFLTTNYIDTKEWLPLNLLYYLISITKNQYVILSNGASNINQKLSLTSDTEKDAAKTMLARFYKKIPAEDREIFIEDIRYQLTGNQNIDLPDDLMMLDQFHIKEMYTSGLISFGSHTSSHLLLARGSKEKVRSELEKSKKVIEKIIKNKIFHFAYPNGTREDFLERDKIIIQQLGYKSACTTIEGTNIICNRTDMFELKRFPWKTPNYLLATKILLGKIN